VTSGGWEPDALTAQVRFWEGSAFNRARIEYCDTTKRKRVANSEHKPYPKLERLRSTHRADGLRRLLQWKTNRPSPVMATVLPLEMQRSRMGADNSEQ
jgi:hypothetical protein